MLRFFKLNFLVLFSINEITWVLQNHSFLNFQNELWVSFINYMSFLKKLNLFFEVPKVSSPELLNFHHANSKFFCNPHDFCLLKLFFFFQTYKYQSLFLLEFFLYFSYHMKQFCFELERCVTHNTERDICSYFLFSSRHKEK